MFHEKYIKYKNKYLNEKIKQLGGSNTNSVQNKYSSLIGDAMSFFIPENSTIFISTFYFDSKNGNNWNKTTIYSLQELLNEMRPFINDPSYGAKKLMVDNLIKRIRNFFDCILKKMSKTSILHFINNVTEHNGLKLQVPTQPFYNIENINIEFMEKLLHITKDIECDDVISSESSNNSNKNILIYSPNNSPDSPIVTHLPNSFSILDVGNTYSNTYSNTYGDYIPDYSSNNILDNLVSDENMEEIVNDLNKMNFDDDNLGDEEEISIKKKPSKKKTSKKKTSKKKIK